jgi:hypothetical protein
MEKSIIEKCTLKLTLFLSKSQVKSALKNQLKLPFFDENQDMTSSTSGFISMLKMRCPNCRKGRMFKVANPYILKSLGEMPVACPVCNQPFRLEPGFYFGAAYISYGLMVGWNMFITLLIYLIYHDVFNHFVELMVSGIVTTLLVSPWMFRYSRVLYLYMFVRFRRGTVIK